MLGVVQFAFNLISHSPVSLGRGEIRFCQRLHLAIIVPSSRCQYIHTDQIEIIDCSIDHHTHTDEILDEREFEHIVQLDMLVFKDVLDEMN